MAVYVGGGIAFGVILGGWLGEPILVAIFGAFVGTALGVAFRR